MSVKTLTIAAAALALTATTAFAGGSSKPNGVTVLVPPPAVVKAAPQATGPATRATVRVGQRSSFVRGYVSSFGR
jgi:hypothetical protein